MLNWSKTVRKTRVPIVYNCNDDDDWCGETWKYIAHFTHCNLFLAVFTIQFSKVQLHNTHDMVPPSLLWKRLQANQIYKFCCFFYILDINMLNLLWLFFCFASYWTQFLSTINKNVTYWPYNIAYITFPILYDHFE